MAPAGTISLYNSVRRVNSLWNTRQCRSVQSIMGATENFIFFSITYIGFQYYIEIGRTDTASFCDM
jgi:hypothetical protein